MGNKLLKKLIEKTELTPKGLSKETDIPLESLNN